MITINIYTIYYGILCTSGCINVNFVDIIQKVRLPICPFQNTVKNTRKNIFVVDMLL